MSRASRDKRIVAFYGYKGGAGRSLLAANISVVLSLMGKRVLLIDWDLEAPGVGDYFNGASDLIPQMWRTHRGLFELLVKCRRMPEGGDLRPIIREFLTAKDYRRAVLPVKFTDFRAKGSLEFVGPGRQVGPEFAAALMTSDWADFFLTHGEAFHKAFRDVVRDEEIGYDVIIIDTRTGYNLSTIFILRLLADIVYFVAPKITQALLGISSVWKLIPFISSDDKGLRSHVAA